MPYQTPNNKGTGDILKKGAAEYQSWMQLTESQANIIKAAEGTNYATSTDPLVERYAQLVHVVNGITIDASDIQIGAVELKDGDADIRATIVDLTNSNAIAVQLMDSNGDALTTFGGDAEGTPNAAANTKVIQLGAIAETTIPTAVADGDAVAIWADEYGRIRIGGYSLATDSLDVTVLNDTTISRLGPIDVIPVGTTSVTTGTPVDISNYHNVSIHLNVTGSPSGSTIKVQHSHNGTDRWVTIDEVTPTAAEVIEFGYSNVAYKYIQVLVETYSAGTFGATLYAGN